MSLSFDTLYTSILLIRICKQSISEKKKNMPKSFLNLILYCTHHICILIRKEIKTNQLVFTESNFKFEANNRADIKMPININNCCTEITNRWMQNEITHNSGCISIKLSTLILQYCDAVFLIDKLFAIIDNHVLDKICYSNNDSIVRIRTQTIV